MQKRNKITHKFTPNDTLQARLPIIRSWNLTGRKFECYDNQPEIKWQTTSSTLTVFRDFYPFEIEKKKSPITNNQTNEPSILKANQNKEKWIRPH